MAKKTVAGATRQHDLLKISAACMGLALPGMVLANSLTYVLLVFGLIAGYLAPGKVPVEAGWGQIMRNRGVQGALVLLAWLGFVSTIGMNPAFALNHWATTVFMFVCGCGMYQVFAKMGLDNRRDLLKWMCDSVLASFVFCALILILENWLILHHFYEGKDEWTQTHLRFYSSVLAVILPMCWLYWLGFKDGKLKLDVRATGLIGLSLFMVFMCAGRAGWMGLAVSAPIMAWVLVRWQGFRPSLKLAAAGLAGTAVACVLGFLWIFGESYLQERVGMVVPARGLGGGRLEIWAMAWKGFLEHPLFGIGVNDFRFLPGADAHPHNFALQLALEGGLPALLMTLGLVAWLAFAWKRGMRTNPLLLTCFAGLMGFFVCALTNKSIFNPEWLVYPAFIVALGASTFVRKANVKV